MQPKSHLGEINVFTKVEKEAIVDEFEYYNTKKEKKAVDK
jgi:hypothetical protein